MLLRSLIVILLLYYTTCQLSFGQFSPTATSVPALYYASSDWGDYDNDGDLDLLIIGRTSTSTSSQYAAIFRNDAGSLANIGATIQGLYDGDVEWVDYDNDGDLDFIVTGRYSGLTTGFSRIYRNDSSIFTEMTGITLPGVYNSSVDWGDFDNDGDLDLLITGQTSTTTTSIISRVYSNTNGVLTLVLSLQGVSQGDGKWADYDSDGDLDIAITGFRTSYFSIIYNNNNGNFTNINAPLFPCYQSDLSWGDYDSDGDLDLALIGFNGTTYSCRIYRNNAGSFSDIGAVLSGAANGSVHWGDSDNDGDLDLFYTGNNLSKIYLNNNGTFTDSGIPLVNLNNSFGKWGDFDNDNDLDLIVFGSSAVAPLIRTILYTNTSSVPNTIPNPPSGLLFTGGNYIDSIDISWSSGTDNQTVQNGLNYNLFLRKNGITQSIVESMSLQTGQRKIVNIGNRAENRSFSMNNLSIGTYVFGVQSIDASYKGSIFKVDSFKIVGIITGSISSPICGADTIYIPFIINDTLTTHTTFVAQLSNASGSFLTPTDIGSTITNTSGIITAVIPGITTTGNAYRIRVVAVNPSLTGYDNGTNLIIYQQPVTTISAAGATAFCQGGSVQLQSTALTGSSYQWFRESVAIVGSTTTSYIANQSGTYSIRVTRNGCVNFSNSIVVTVNPIPSAILIPTGTTNICQGDSIPLTTNFYSNATYVWRRNGFLISTPNSNTYYASTAGNYTVSVTLNGCSATSGTTVIVVNPYPTANITSGGITTFCQGSNVILTTTAYTGASYQWRIGGVNLIGATSSTYTATQGGVYSVQITRNGCRSTSPNFTLTMQVSPLITSLGSTSICQGNSVLLSAQSIIGYAYQWKLNGVNITSATTNLYTATQTGTYTLAVNTGTCNFTSNSINLIVNPTPTVNVSSSTNSICQGGSALITANYNQDYLYQWLYNGTTIVGANTNQYLLNQTGNYSVQIISSSTGCSNTSALLTISSLTTPIGNINISGNSTFCQGGSVVLSTTNSVNQTYQWYNNSVLIPGANTSSLTATDSGQYFVRTTNTISGCIVTSNSVTVTVNQNPNTAVSAVNGITSICQGDTTRLEAYFSNGYTYQWSLNNTSIVGATNPFLVINLSGSYKVMVTSPNGCSASSATIQVSVSQNPNSLLSNPNPSYICDGQSITLSANNGMGFNYFWYRNDTLLTGSGSSLITNYPGQYKVKVSNNFGCYSFSNEISVIINNLPSIIFNITDFDFCRNDEPIGLTAFPAGGIFTGSGVAGNYFYPNQVLSLNSTITYSLTDNNGCTDSVKHIITTYPAPIADFTYFHLCEDNKIQFINNSIDSIQSLSQQLWNFPTGISSDNNPIFEFDNEGTQIVELTVRNFYNCSDTIRKNINSYFMPTALFLNPDTIVYGEILELTNNSLNSSEFSWIFGDGNSSLLEDPNNFYSNTGTYMITLFSSNESGCVDSFRSQITVRSVYEKDFELVLYPNPSNGHFWINIELEDSTSVELITFDALGHMVFNKVYDSLPAGFSSLEVLLPFELANGSYYVCLYVDGKNSNVRNFNRGVLVDLPLNYSRYRKVIISK